jgi:hypothetical protein
VAVLGTLLAGGVQASSPHRATLPCLVACALLLNTSSLCAQLLVRAPLVLVILIDAARALHAAHADGAIFSP